MKLPKLGFDTHGSVYATIECVVITVPVSGWYRTEGNKEIYLTAGTTFTLNGPFKPSDPSTLAIRTVDSKE